jgi:hypothetical protein
MGPAEAVGRSVPSRARAAWGALLLTAPGVLLSAVAARDVGPGPRRLVRLLGARHLAEVIVGVTFPTARRWTGVADALHAATAIVLAIRSRRWRRAAIADAFVATAFAVTTLASAARTPGEHRGPTKDRVS